MIIQQGMTIRVRTQEELEILIEVCKKEGHQRTHRSYRGSTLDDLLNQGTPCSISCGLYGDKFPKDISRGLINGNYKGVKTYIEASQLFRNQLISKRLK